MFFGGKMTKESNTRGRQPVVPDPTCASQDAPAGQPRERRDYRAPRLTIWGTVQDLTLGGGGASLDASLTFTKSV
jgi:hypothetical protein